VATAATVLLLAFGTLGLVGSSPADAQVQRSQFTLRLVDESGGSTVVKLTCNPDGGTHPNPTTACNSLRAASGDFNRLPPDPTVSCLFVYEPVQAYASGQWRGRAVTFAHTYGNACEAAVESGHVFDF
jgi:hypothetical protein